MKKLTYPAALIRAAQAAQGVNDVRHYLNGILLSSNGAVCGTDGHIAFKGRAPADQGCVEEDVIVKIDGKIPGTASDVTFIFEDGRNGMCRTDNKKAFTFSIVDGKFPDVDRVIPDLPRHSNATGFSVNAGLIARLADIFGKEASLAMYPGDQRDAVLVQYYGADNTRDIEPALVGAVAVVMPLRSDAEFERLYTLENAEREIRGQEQVA